MAPEASLFSSPFKASVEYNPEPIREIIRGLVTLAAMTTFFLVIWFFLHQAALSSEPIWARITQAMQAILPAVTSILGTALGFYFGSQKR